MLKQFTPLLLLLILPLWHTCERLNGSFLLLFSGGSYAFFKEIFLIPLHSIVSAISFYVFIQKVAPKFSLILTSFALVLMAYFFFPPPYFYHHLGVFILASALTFNDRKNCQHLFFSLFFLTLLHTFSALFLCIIFYGTNIPLFLTSFAPITALICLHNKRIYPSIPALISLFPLNLFPISYFVHNIIPLDIPFICSIVFLIAAIYVILEKRSLSYLFLLFVASITVIFFNSKAILFPFIFTPCALLVGMMQILLSSKPKTQVSSIKIGRILKM